jgi:hypothetical protein
VEKGVGKGTFGSEYCIVLSVAWPLLLHLLYAVNNAPRHLLRSGWFLGRVTWALIAMTPSMKSTSGIASATLELGLFPRPLPAGDAAGSGRSGGLEILVYRTPADDHGCQRCQSAEL